MAEKKKYNSILVSGRKDQTLTYSKYVKDEESGESVKESLDKKVNVTDELTTQQIKDGAITNEKMAADSVGNSNLQDGSVSNEKLEDGSITNEKLAENSITKDKLKDNTIGVEKLDPELRQTINAATGLPENLVETIQNVDDTLKDHQRQLDDKQSQIDDKQQQITANDEDISLLQTRSTQMEETIKSIAATGGASQATAVTYNNEKSKLTAVNIQSAVDEVVDKTAIKDEEGALIETPFRYIQNEEFIFAKVDAEDKLLFGIQWDGTPKFGKTSAVEDRLQSQVTLLAERVATIMGDEDTTNVIDTMNELKKFFAEIENTQTLTSILANLDKTTIKDEEGNIQDTPFRVIENDEYIIAVVDAESRILAGIKYDGKPYFPNHEMYSVITNEEWLYAIIDAEDKVLGGFRANDGHMIVGSIDISTFIANAIIDIADIKERTAHLSTIENDEYLSVETDADGKVIGYIALDGSHYLYNVKSETIPTEFSHIEDPEGRTEITTDAEDKILGYRDSEGTRHEHKISAKHLELSDEAATEVSEAFKSAGIKMENPSDFSKDSHIELPIPRIAAQVRIYAPMLPTTKQDDIEAEIEYNDKDGNYFKKPVILNAQGSSSMNYYVKNMAIDINDGSVIKFGDFPAQDSFHLKKYYIDIFRGQCIVGYHLMEQVYKSHPIGQQYPYEYNYSNESESTGLGDVKKDFFTGAKCHPDGFPIIITWVNTKSKEETWMGIYAWNLKKSKEVFFCDKKKSSNILLDGNLNSRTLWGGNVDWTMFEIRNPKSLIDINGNKYDGDNPVEPSNTDSFSKSVKDSITRLSSAMGELKANQNKETFEKYFLVNPFIDYYLTSQILYNYDGFDKNWLWETLNSNQWFPNLYDIDSIFGQSVNGAYFEKNSIEEILGTADDLPSSMLVKLYESEIKNRYWELKNKSIFTTDNIVRLLNDWLNRIGYDNISKEIKAYPETPSYRKSFLNSNWELVKYTFLHGFDNYDNTKEYAVGEECVYLDYKFKALNSTTGNPPLDSTYNNNPIAMGMFNSVSRVKNWLDKRIAFLDNYYKI